MRTGTMSYAFENYDVTIGTFWPRGTDGYTAYESAAYADLHQRFPDTGQYTAAKVRAIQVFLHRMRLGGERNLCNHSFYGYYDRFWRDGAQKSKAFVEKRPDYFAKGYEGEPPQLCYTSRGLIRQVEAQFSTAPLRPDVGSVAPVEAPGVTVTIPTFNSARSLAICLRK